MVIRCMLGRHRPKEDETYGREHAEESRCGF
jgi:hypothetical protein